MSTAPPVPAMPRAPAPDTSAAAAAVPAAPATAPAAQAAAPVHCENCGALVSQQYCGVCGQRLEPPLHSLWHFTQVAAEDLTHADSRLWRTLAALLFKPGHLTQEFLAGRRASYLPPVRLYLVLSVAFFLVASAVPTHLAVVQFDDSKPVASAKLGNIEDLAASKSDETPEQRADRLCAKSNYNGPWASTLQPRFRQACRRTVMDNGRELQEAFLHNVPRAMFVFLPLLAGLMMLMYWRPPHYYVEHLLLFVHNHAFVFLVLGLLMLLRLLVPHIPGLNFAIFLYFTWYMYRSMRVAYGHGRLLTISKLVLLAFFYLVFASLMLAATSLYSLFTL